jgi:hypothetical protein
VEPVVGDRSKLVHHAGHKGGGDDPERPALLLETSERLTVLPGLGAIEREGRKVHSRLFTELDEGQAEIGVAVQAFPADLVEHGDAAEVVAALEEQSNETRQPVGRSDGVSKGNPRPSLDAVHHEALAVLVEEQRLVPQVPSRPKSACREAPPGDRRPVGRATAPAAAGPAAWARR